MNSQHTQNALTNQKSSAAYFKDVKAEEAFSNQDQKLVETTNLWKLQLSSDKKSPQQKSASAMNANPVKLMIGTTMNSSRLLN